MNFNASTEQAAGSTQHTYRGKGNNLVLQDGVTQMQQQWRSLTRKHICAPSLMKELTMQHSRAPNHDRSNSSSTEEKDQPLVQRSTPNRAVIAQARTQKVLSRNTMNPSKTEAEEA